MASAQDTLRIAHSARCKLHMAASRPDRNFRFILGHALTLDKLMLRVAEIEIDLDSDNLPDCTESGLAAGSTPQRGPGGRRVSFSAGTTDSPSAPQTGPARPVMKNGTDRRRSPPPPEDVPYDRAEEDEAGDEMDDDDDAAIDDDGDDDGLGLQRFPSASAQPPRMTASDSMGADEAIGDMEGRSDLDLNTMSEDEIRRICAEGGDEEMARLYNGMVRCPCNEDHAVAPKMTRFWEMPGKGGLQGGRIGLMQVEA